MSLSTAKLEWERKKRKARRENGLCVECGATAIPGQARCDYCQENSAERELRARHKREASGLCSRCTDKALPGFRKCAKHRAMDAVYARRKTERKRAERNKE